MLLQLASTRTRQPLAVAPLDRSGVGRGLVLLLTGGEGGRDRARNVAPALTSGANVRARRAGRAIEFNGTTGYLDFGSPAAYSFSEGGTLVALVELGTLATAPAHIFSIGDASTRTLALYANDGSVSNFSAGGWTNGGGYANRRSTNGGLSTGRPYLLVATYSATGAIASFELDGVAHTTAGSTTFNPPDVNTITVGCRRQAGPTYNGFFTGFVYLAAAWNRILSAAERASLVANPWQLFAAEPPHSLAFFPTVVGVYRPSGTLSAGGWIATGAATLHDAINESSASDAEFITSPDLSTPNTLNVSPSLPAGTWAIRVRGQRNTGAGQVRVRCLDASSVDVGGSDWQTLGATFTTYELGVVTTAPADRIRIEVQP